MQLGCVLCGMVAGMHQALADEAKQCIPIQGILQGALTAELQN